MGVFYHLQKISDIAMEGGQEKLLMADYYEYKIEKKKKIHDYGLKYVFCLVFSVILNLFLVVNFYLIHESSSVGGELSWSRGAATEAEAVASISCSGHGRAYLDGVLTLDGTNPICECNTCYGGHDCSQFSPDCPANVDSGDPLFLEPFWMKNAATSALMVAGWHRMSYNVDGSFISKELEKLIRELHTIIGNANTTGKFIVFGAGSTQLLNSAIYALSPKDSPSPSSVVASIPFYPVYKYQTNFFKSMEFKWQGDTSLWKNKSNNSSMNFIEFVTSPNNPDGKLTKQVLQQGLSVKAIHDHAYYWPHFSAITAPANEELMIFTLSKITGHAGSRFGWALVRDEGTYERITRYMGLNSMGVSRDAQLRALKLLKVVLEGGGREFFEFGHKTTMTRWDRLNKIVSASKRFSLQKLKPQYCTYFQNVTQPSPAYAWMKCEKEEDQDCSAVLEASGIIGRKGKLFSAEDRYVRLSLIKTQDDFEQLLQKMDTLVSKEGIGGGGGA